MAKAAVINTNIDLLGTKRSGIKFKWFQRPMSLAGCVRFDVHNIWFGRIGVGWEELIKTGSTHLPSKRILVTNTAGSGITAKPSLVWMGRNSGG